MRNIKTTALDISEFLDDDEVIVKFLENALKEDDGKYFYTALAEVAKAKGMTKIAKEAGISRTTLYKTLTESREPKLTTAGKVLKALGYDLSLKVAS